ncbi:MAG: ABC transporter permease [Candidatus Bipolaricaulota bacterium]
MGGSLAKVARYMLVRAILLFITVVIGVYLTVIVANMGGHLDELRREQITYEIQQQVYMDPENRSLPGSTLQQMVEQRAEVEFRRLGLDRPFFPWRSLEFLWIALSLDLGRSETMTSDAGSRMVRNVITERLPPTLLLFGTANMVLFFGGLGIALSLSRRYGSFLDRAVITLAPTSAAPGWFYGLFLILIFAAVLRVLPWGGLVRAPPPKEPLAYALSLLRHLILPTTAMVIGALFGSVYSWRTFFLIYSSEDYVELARAKGLSGRRIQNRYILRPTLPTIITNFVLMVITMWMGALVLELVFNWPGIGRMYLAAVNLNDTPIIVGIIVIYAYLLALMVWLLDFIYAVVDPRVRVGGGSK